MSQTENQKEAETVQVTQTEGVEKKEEGAPAAQPTSASLYVGELDPSVTEAMLFETFNAIGPVSSIRVCRDAVTRQSLGYAYVNYHSSQDGEKAIEELNYSLIRNRPCRIMWSQRDPALRKTGSGNVFIKNLDLAIDNKALHDTFSAFGNILSCKVATDELGNSKGFGFVHYETQESADSAIKHVNGMLLNDKQVYVGIYVAKKDRQSKFDEMKSNFTNVYVKNLDEAVADDELVKMFEKFGSITSGVISKTAEGASKGFGFVNFEKHEDAEKAVAELNDSEVNGKKLFVCRAQNKYERQQELQKQYEALKQEKIQKYQGVNLYVKNLADEVDEEILKKEFESFGTITSVKVMKEDGKSKGFGFICFSTPEEAIAAVTEMNQRMVSGKPLYVALAQRKEVRRSQLGAQIQQRSQMRLQQQVAAAGMPGYMGAPMYFNQPPFGMPPQAMAGRGNGPFPGQVPGAMYNRPYQQRPANGQGMPMYGGPQGVPNYARPGGRGRGQYPPQAGRNGPESAAVAAALAAADPSTHKQVLGEALYPKVQELEPELAGKVTGMLLEIDNSEILSLLDDKELLQQKVKEALTIYDEYIKSEGEKVEKTEA